MSANPKDRTTLVSEIMTRDVLTVHPEQPAQAAVDVIVDHVITGVPVVDDTGRCVGIVSESDVLSKRGQTVADIMTTDVVSVDENETLEAAAAVLLTRHIRRLPVVRDDRLVGILTRADLVRRVRQTHWTCDWCSLDERGLRPPNACPGCGGESWQLIVEPRG